MTQTFAEIKSRLNEIIATVDDRELSLDETLALYEEAVGLAAQVSQAVESGIDIDAGAEPADAQVGAASAE